MISELTIINCVLLSSKGTYCPPVSPIPNGRCRCNSKKDLSYCEPIYSSMQIECTCNLGYRIVGNQLLTCTGRGQWNYDQPTCVKGMVTMNLNFYLACQDIYMYTSSIYLDIILLCVTLNLQYH